MRLNFFGLVKTLALAWLFAAAPAFAEVTTVENLPDGTEGKAGDVKVDKAKSQWPKRATVDTAKSADKELIFSDAPESTGEKWRPGQTFTCPRAITLSRIYIRYATQADSGSFTIRIQEVPEGANGMTYAPGKDLFPTPAIASYKVNTHGAPRIMEIQLAGDHRITLEAKKLYVIEIVDQGAAPLSWYRAKGDVYPGGYAYQKNTQMMTPSDQSRDFSLAIDGE